MLFLSIFTLCACAVCVKGAVTLKVGKLFFYLALAYAFMLFVHSIIFAHIFYVETVAR